MTTDNHDVLEQNVSTLLETGGERPQISDAARTRIRAELVAKHGAKHGVIRTRARSPLVAVGAGLAAMAAAALIVGRLVAGDSPARSVPLALPGSGDAVRAVAGAEVVGEPGAKVTELGPRRLRVEGAALIDVAPGKGAFVVETAHGRIEVLGTKFLVDGERDRTTAAVVRGQVKLATAGGDVVLHAGEQAIAEPGHPPVRGPAPRLSHLVSWAREARHRDEHAAQPLHHGTLFARDPGVRSHPPWGAEYPLPIAKLGLDVVVEDQVARVALDQTFHNPASQALEGVYRFAIPPDAALQRLAMYVDGKLMESAVVERMAARRIYEELVYRRVDPALLEWAGTGRLSLRVYPIPALQDKRLMLAYTQSLPKLYDDWTLSIPLPEVDQPVGAMDVSVRVRGCANCELTSTSHRVEVVREGADAIVRYHRAGETIGDSFVLHVRDARKATTIARSERGGECYLLVRAPGELAAGPRAYRPRTWVILDDVSASRSHLELRAQADVIDGFLRELDEEDRVAVVAFDVEARTKLPRTRVLDVDRHAVRTALDPEGGVGATDVDAALDAALAQLAGVDPDDAMIVYLGDGVITGGARNLDALRAKLAGKAHFVGVGIGDGPDTQTLQSLASATGGYATTMDLADDLGWRAFDLVAALHTSRVTGLDARLVDAGGQLVPSATYLASPQLADGEELELIAKLAGGGTPAAVELTGTMNGAPWRRTIALDGTPDRAAGYLPRLWAQRHIAARLLAKHEPVVIPPCSGAAAVRGKPAALCPSEVELREARDEAIRKDVVSLGKQYFLLSRHTSLLVLENDDMYTRYGVTKGAGDSWAPYAMPTTIPVVTATTTVVASNIADDAELIRAPMQVFYNTDGYLQDRWGEAEADFGVAQQVRRDGLLAGRRGARAGDFAPMAISTVSAGPTLGAFGQPTGSTRAQLRISADPEELAALNKISDKTASLPQAEAKADARATSFDPFRTGPFRAGSFHAGLDERVEKQRSVVVAGAGGLIGDLEAGWGGGKAGGGSPWGSGQPTAARLGYPTDPAFDDVTAFIPALLPGAADRWRDELKVGGDAKAARQVDPQVNPHGIDDAAKALLVAARRALPTGIYRWGDVELAVDDVRRIGWRRTSEAGLAETASYDGTTWTRRYAELGLDVTRAVGDDDVALQLGYLPVWIAEPSHYARWFDVTLRGKREVVLSRRVRGQAKPVLVLVLAFDDRSRLVAITDAAGAKLVEIAWAVGPTRARVGGDELAVGFTGQAVADAAQWAHRDAAPGIAVELPAHLPAYWQAKLATEAAGSPTWRHAQRQRMVALAATQDRAGLWQVYDQLRTHGGVSLGELALASGGVASSPTDAQLAAALAPLAHQPLARYLIAGRAFGKAQRPERLASASRDGVPDGLVKALWSLRTVTAYARTGKARAAADELVAMGDRALELRLLGAAACGNQWDLAAADVARAWDAAAAGPYRNVARAAAAQALFQRGKYDAGAERTAQLVADLDLQALPPRLDEMMYSFQQSRRGQAGWQMVWATWRARVLAGTSYAHVMALLFASAQQGGEIMPILARAAELAGDDPGRTLVLAQLAIGRGQGAWAEALVQPLRKAQPSHDLYQLVASIELQQGRLGEALADLEAAQDAGADDAVDLATVRAELAQIIDVARRLAVASTGAGRDQAVARALAWGRRWRAIDEGNPEIDQRLGELMLAIGDHKAAWRQLSSTIERDPWSGAGYTVVAEAFERQGRIADALPFWQQAIVIDQTNPTPRLRKAQALIALGRTAEGDALLAEIAQRRWHELWIGVAEQARELLERGKSSQR